MREHQIHGITGELSCLAWGSPDQQPVLMVHGWLDNAASYIPMMQHLKDYYWVALDLAGHGRSQHRPQGVHYHLVDYVRDIDAVIEHFGWDKVHLVGHSLGASIVALYAATFPEKVNKLVLIDWIGPFISNHLSSVDQLRQSIEEVKKPQQVKHYPSWQKLVSRRAQNGGLSLKNAELLMQRATMQNEGEIYASFDGRLKNLTPIYLTEDKIISFLTRIQSPTLLVKPDEGHLIDYPLSAGQERAIVNLEIARLPGHHHVHMESAKEVAGLMMSFLAQQ